MGNAGANQSAATPNPRVPIPTASGLARIAASLSSASNAGEARGRTHPPLGGGKDEGERERGGDSTGVVASPPWSGARTLARAYASYTCEKRARFPGRHLAFCVMSRRGLLPSTPRARVVDPVLL